MATQAQPIEGASVPEEVFVSFSKFLDVDATESLITTVSSLVNAKVETIVLCLSSFGGNFARSVSLYNFLRAMPCHVITFNVGHVASAANVLFLAGEERFASKHATFMFHPSTLTLDGTSLSPQQLSERSAAMTADDDRERQMIKERTLLTSAQIKAIVDGSTTIDSSAALTAGIIHEVKELEVPDGAPMLTA